MHHYCKYIDSHEVFSLMARGLQFTQNVEAIRTPSAKALKENSSKIIQDWEHRVRDTITAAKELSHPILIDTVPAFLDSLAEALSQDHPRTVISESLSISQEHGSERARLSRYSPDHLISEYLLLRDTIIEHLEAALEMTSRDRSLIQTSFDIAISEAMLAFFLVHSKIREQFIAGLSHDLRNPIGAARMAADLILMTAAERQGPINGEVTDLAKRIVSNCKRADRLIQNLLDTSLIQMGDRMDLNIGEYEILSIVKDVLQDINRNELARIRIEGHPQWGFWDGDALRRVVENLLSNAFKYGRSGTSITVTVSSAQGRLLLKVHNLGSPIPIEDQERLFQAFRRTVAARSSGKKGWGIGLALVRGVAEAHGGSVGVDSSLERGTTFIFDIPIDSRPFLHAPVT
jgi:signal transduction histidine kinase